MSDLDRLYINELISEKKYEEAKSILRKSTDPSAQTWLNSLESKFPPPEANSTSSRLNGLDIGQSLNINSYSSKTSQFGTEQKHQGFVNVLNFVPAPLAVVLIIGGFIVGSQLQGNPILLILMLWAGLLIYGGFIAVMIRVRKTVPERNSEPDNEHFLSKRF